MGVKTTEYMVTLYLGFRFGDHSHVEHPAGSNIFISPLSMVERVYEEADDINGQLVIRSGEPRIVVDVWATSLDTAIALAGDRVKALGLTVVGVGTVGLV